MKTAVINFKTDPKVKKEAQAMAKKLGLNLSMVLDQLLRQFVRDKELRVSLEPTPRLEQVLKASDKDIRGGHVSPTFDTAEGAISWLNDGDARYENGRKV